MRMFDRRSAVLAALPLACAMTLAAGNSLADATEAADAGLVAQGRQLYETVGGVGCKGCHGAFGEGKLGPTNRGVNEATIRESLDKIGAMQFLKEHMTERDVAPLAAYTQWMGRHMLIHVLLKRGRFIPETVSVYPGTPVQLVIENAGSEPSTINGEQVVAARR